MSRIIQLLVLITLYIPAIGNAASIAEQKDEYQRGTLMGCMESTQGKVDPDVAKKYCTCMTEETMKNINKGLTDAQFRDLMAGSKGAKALSDIPHSEVAFEGVVEKCRPGAQ